MKKSESILAMIRRSFKYLDVTSYCAIYFALIRSRLEYSVCAWNPHLIQDVNKIERVQRRFTRMLPEMMGLSYSERLHRLNMQSLEVRRCRADLIMLYKIVHGFIDFPMEEFFHYADSAGTRGHSLRLRTNKIPRLDVKKCNFANRVVGTWNSLSEYVVTALCVASFKIQNSTPCFRYAESFRFCRV